MVYLLWIVLIFYTNLNKLILIANEIVYVCVSILKDLRVFVSTSGPVAALAANIPF